MNDKEKLAKPNEGYMRTVRKFLFISLIQLVSIFRIYMIIGFAQTPDSLYYIIVQKFPSPGPSPQGLAWDGDFLWVSDDSMSSIYKLNPINGSIIKSVQSPGPKPRGLTWDGQYLWCSDDSIREIFKLDTSGVVIKAIPAPVDLPCNRKGLTWDGHYLWSAFFAGWSSKVNQIDTTNGIIKQWFYQDAEGLAFDGSYLWIVDSQEGHYLGFINKRNTSGELLAYSRTPGYYPTGLTYDGYHFWLADCGADTICKLKFTTTNIEMRPDISLLPITYKCYNYPNPFNQSTTVKYQLPKELHVNLKVFNMLGEEVAILVDKQLDAGYYAIQWNAKSQTSGMYFILIQSGEFSEINKMVLLR